MKAEYDFSKMKVRRFSNARDNPVNEGDFERWHWYQEQNRRYRAWSHNKYRKAAIFKRNMIRHERRSVADR